MFLTTVDSVPVILVKERGLRLDAKKESAFDCPADVDMHFQTLKHVKSSLILAP